MKVDLLTITLDDSTIYLRCEAELNGKHKKRCREVCCWLSIEIKDDKHNPTITKYNLEIPNKEITEEEREESRRFIWKTLFTGKLTKKNR